MLVEKFTLHSMNAPCRQELPKLRDNSPHVIHGPTKRSQEVV